MNKPTLFWLAVLAASIAGAIWLYQPSKAIPSEAVIRECDLNPPPFFLRGTRYDDCARAK